MEINRIDSLFPIRPNHAPIPESPAEPQANPSDRVEISPRARFRDQLRQVPDVRAETVAALRRAIGDGTYDVENKLVEVLDKLLDDLT
ncbi:MAG: flagellar biosynthesis anti-sigma factor FlgM [Planctomycetes bacterium]|nr:flagellar biosynthesis anti-sigma factor FlgM [Planctomycetota bacterium]